MKDIWGSKKNDIFAVGFVYELNRIPGPVRSKIYHYDGNQWMEMENDFSTLLFSVWGSSSTDVFAVGSEEFEHSQNGTILHYDGNTWVVMKENVPFSLHGIWGCSATEIYAVGETLGKDTMIMHYDGTEWAELNVDANVNAYGSLRGIWCSSESDVIAVGGGMLHYDRVEWHFMNDGVKAFCEDVWGGSTTDVFAVGWKHVDYTPVGVVLKYVCDR